MARTYVRTAAVVWRLFFWRAGLAVDLAFVEIRGKKCNLENNPLRERRLRAVVQPWQGRALSSRCPDVAKALDFPVPRKEPRPAEEEIMPVVMRLAPPLPLALPIAAAEQWTAFSVVPIPGKGFGCIATRDIEQGERILAEAPMIVQGAGMPPLAEVVGALSSHERQRFFDLAQNSTRFGDVKTPAGIVATNGIPFREGARQLGGVFPTASRLNHACDSNCVYKWNSALGMLTVHCCRGIRAGEECTFNYGFDSIYMHRATRRERLSASFGFDCACARCGMGAKALAMRCALTSTLTSTLTLTLIRSRRATTRKPTRTATSIPSNFPPNSIRPTPSDSFHPTHCFDPYPI